jgi:serine/threonine-protein kinase HipA
MTTSLSVWMDHALVGHLHHDSKSNQFAFTYAPEWERSSTSFALSPAIPLAHAGMQRLQEGMGKQDAEKPNVEQYSAEKHSALVRQFFENLLPEGDALDVAALANRVSKSNLVGLMLALGKETTGAIRILPGDAEFTSFSAEDHFREITPAELSERIRDRQRIPFSQWDGQVRLSIAGYQDKIAVYEKNGKWFLVEGPRFASTTIMKPVPQRPQLASLPANEFFCMTLAKAVGLQTAEVDIQFVPEPILLVKRFDRIDHGDGVNRLHVIDACQALGVSVAMKYERPYGDSRDVKDIRDGVRYASLFELTQQCINPLKERLQLLRWVLFQVLIGNHDAHGKNLSFFLDESGLRSAPAYDLVCMPALSDAGLSDHFGMAIGDAFTEAEINAQEWEAFAHDCGLKPKLVAKELVQMSQRILKALPFVSVSAREKGISEDCIERLHQAISTICHRQSQIAGSMLKPNSVRD